MTEHKVCTFCRGNTITRVNTYKSYWYSCNDCGNVLRETKDTYFFERLIPRWVWGKIPPKQLSLVRPKSLRELIVYALYKNREMTGQDMYDYYLDPDLGQTDAKTTKWAPETDDILRELKEFGVDLTGKTVLEISGGPGFVAKNLESKVKKYIVTEFNATSAERMHSVLGLNAYKFDFNSDNIADMVTDKIDVVLLRHCVNFCLDINKFLRELKPLLNNGAVIYVSTALPTLGNYCRWSLDDYTFLVLQNPETIAKNFAEEGFRRSGVILQNSYHYLHSRVHRLHLYASPMTLPFFLWNKFKPINTEAEVKLRAMMFRPQVDSDS